MQVAKGKSAGKHNKGCTAASWAMHMGLPEGPRLNHGADRNSVHWSQHSFQRNKAKDDCCVWSRVREMLLADANHGCASGGCTFTCFPCCCMSFSKASTCCCKDPCWSGDQAKDLPLSRASQSSEEPTGESADGWSTDPACITSKCNAARSPSNCSHKTMQC